MQLNLNEDEVRVLRDTLNDYLPELRRQAAATDLPARELKSELKRRVELIERLLGDLDRGRAGR